MEGETHPVIELLEVDNGAVLPLLERLVGPRAVVVRHPPRAVPLIRVPLLRAVPAACHASPQTLVSPHDATAAARRRPGEVGEGEKGRGRGDEAARGSTCAVLALGRGGEGGGGVVAGPLVHRGGGARRKILRRLELGGGGVRFDPIRCRRKCVQER